MKFLHLVLFYLFRQVISFDKIVSNSSLIITKKNNSLYFN